MLIQDNNDLIDADDIKDMFPEPFLYDCNDPSLVGKFTIVVILKNGETQYLDKVFDRDWQACIWINDIAKLQEFELELRNYRF